MLKYSLQWFQLPDKYNSWVEESKMCADELIERYWKAAEMIRDDVEAKFQYVLPQEFIGESKYLLCVELY
jgi:hypothetical protein